MNFKRLRQIDRLFSRRWDAFVVACLADGPLRLSELAYQLTIHTQTRMNDGTLGRIKHRLLRAGVIHVINDPDGHPTYALTDAGQATADVIKALTDALEECQKAADDRSSPGGPSSVA
jgi:DNA-binding HxlR family transcriptional regulator